jgi:RHS repeat-associated protein
VLVAPLIAPGPAFAAAPIRSVYYDYDMMGRQLSAKFDSATGADKIVNTYNGFGDLVDSTISMGTFSKTVYSHYDGAGRRDLLTHPENNSTYQFSYCYDALSRLTTVAQGSNCTTTPLDTFTYNSDGTLLQRGEGATSASKVVYGWDDIGRLTSQADTFSTTADNVSWGFTLNPASQIASEARTENSNEYAYTGIATGTYTYAPNGLNQYSSLTSASGTTNFGYDPNGNLTSDGTNTYTYDIENRLVTEVNGTVTVSLIYDPLGRLYEVLKKTGTQTNSDTLFLYDGDALALEYDNTKANPPVINRYVHGSNAAADDPLVWYQGVNLNSKNWLHSDHLGSIVAVTDGSNGHVTPNRYDEYGIPQHDAQGVNTNSGRFQYTGQAWIDEVGMYYYKARFYSARLGRFMQTDPVGYQGGVNLYAYADDDPTDRNDPTGLYDCNTAETRLCGSDQKQAIQQLSGQLKVLNSLAKDLRAGSRLSALERSAAARLDKYLGPGAGHSLQAVNKLISAGNAIMGVLRSDAPIVAHSQIGSAYMQTRGGLTSPFPTYIFPRYADASEVTRIETFIHEAAHKGANAPLDVYGSRNAAELARTDPRSAWMNADNIAFGLGFTRDDMP